MLVLRLVRTIICAARRYRDLTLRCAKVSVYCRLCPKVHHYLIIAIILSLSIRASMFICKWSYSWSWICCSCQVASVPFSAQHRVVLFLISLRWQPAKLVFSNWGGGVIFNERNSQHHARPHVWHFQPLMFQGQLVPAADRARDESQLVIPAAQSASDAGWAWNWPNNWRGETWR